MPSLAKFFDVEPTGEPFQILKSRHGRILAAFLLMAFIGAIILDQTSKWEVQKKLLLHDFDNKDIRTFVGDHYNVGSLGDRQHKNGIPFYVGLKFQYSRNPGAAFSMLANLPDAIRVPFFYSITVIALVAIFLIMRKLPYYQHLTRMGLVFIAAGAIGNFLDRLQYGYVVDFIDVDWHIFSWQHDFAIFNVADMAINLGIYFYIAEIYIDWRKGRSNQEIVKAGGQGAT